MKPPRLWSRLVRPVGLAILVVVILMAWRGHVLLEDHERERSYHQLEHLARFIAGEFATAPATTEDRTDRARELCAQFSRAADSRLTIMESDGVVIADSHGDIQTMDNHAERPEMRRALAGEIGVRDRYSDTLDQWMRYVAVPVRVDGKIRAVVRAARPRDPIGSAGIWLTLLVWGALAGVVGILAVHLAVRAWVTRPLAAVVRATRRADDDTTPQADGDANAVWESRETAALASAVRQLAQRGQRRLGEVLEENASQRSVLTSMSEGLLAIDLDERVLNINAAAAAIFKISLDHAIGRTLQEVVRHSQLQRFVGNLLRAPGMVEDDLIVIDQGEERYLQARGSALRNAEGHRIGAVIVINDVTRLRRLENMRRDFAANVSHEIKTPITSIKGFVETLRDGALHDEERAAEFLEIVHRQAGRLESIVDDLLRLARIEQDHERDQLELTTQLLGRVIHAAARPYQGLASERRINIELQLDDTLAANIDATLIEQAVGNLIDNAIKYSPDGAGIEVSLDAEAGDARICVSDHGCGIAIEHQRRLFQRFYRVDRARSRAMGGTGLGLAIVKHIILAHGGSVDVHSEPGRGSAFTLRLPLADADGSGVHRRS